MSAITQAAGQLLQGKTAIITGGGQGIGLAIAEKFLSHGASVLVADIDGEKAAEAIAPLADAGGDIAAHGCDVTVESDQSSLVRAALDRFGRIDILVNNAGVTRDGYISKLTEFDYDLVLGVSLKGAWLGMRAVAPLFRQQGSGAIVNMSSLSGKIGNPGQTNYSAAKAGLIGLTKAGAKEFGTAGVRVNAVQPGLVRTAMTLAMKPEIFAAKEAEVPLGRAGRPEEVADAVVFLSSPMASYINGAVLEVTGGRGI
ncbi:3-oxoacyl-ACP reductase FabG [Arthrobacter sp. MA-N2]|uniref:3-oxoacyl-ACP reductase FabG n=1 Tax=Arthrobacter sp. MA-N2 TaxID=1101188 RepID=UPI00048032AD|nr:3-oxoacyl-ACP reductase FabG [Arthrobacter sp. MA-N2]